MKIQRTQAARRPPLIRPATVRDAAAVSAIYAPYVRRTCISFETAAPTPGEMAERIRRYARTAPWLVCEWDGKVVGYAYASEFHPRQAYRWTVTAAVYVREGYHRRGIGRALYSALIPLLRLQGFRQVMAGIYVPNPGSVGLHEAMGFRPKGLFPAVGYKRGGWRDVGWWQLDLRRAASAPRPPAPSPTLRGHPDWERILQRAAAGLRNVT